MLLACWRRRYCIVKFFIGERNFTKRTGSEKLLTSQKEIDRLHILGESQLEECRMFFFRVIFVASKFALCTALLPRSFCIWYCFTTSLFNLKK